MGGEVVRGHSHTPQADISVNDRLHVLWLSHMIVSLISCHSLSTYADLCAVTKSPRNAFLSVYPCHYEMQLCTLFTSSLWF
jgi:hypothetical protein